MPYPPGNTRAWMPPAEFARHLRLRGTPAERVFLGLRGQTNHAFEYQKIAGPFVADFVCRRCHLTVELDGSAHYGRAEYDAARTAYLATQGMRVVRFHNATVLKAPNSVVQDLRAYPCKKVHWLVYIWRALTS